MYSVLSVPYEEVTRHHEVSSFDARQVWKQLLEVSSKDHLAGMTVPFLNGWLGMMMLPAGVPIDQALLIEAQHRTQSRSQVRNTPLLTGGSAFNKILGSCINCIGSCNSAV